MAKAKAKPVAKRKPAAKRKPSKKPAATKSKPAKPKAKPRKRPPAGIPTVAASLAKLRAWKGGTLEAAPPASDAGARHEAPHPRWGLIMWALPGSYRELLREHSRLAIRWGDGEFVILSPDEIRDISQVVYMPATVFRDDGKYLSTNHLVPFASAGNDECAFCFDVTQPGVDGEYPVYFHHHNEPRARYRDSGEWEDATSATPDFANFSAWLAWVAGELAAGRAPQGSDPTAFYNMPGRKR